MIEEKALYFTPAEFIVMMEISGTGMYTILQGKKIELDDRALAETFSSLFQRGMIQYQDERFVVSALGEPFCKMRGAKFVVMISEMHDYGRTVACYVCGNELWIAECLRDTLSTHYRIQGVKRDEIEEWLFDKEFLDEPFLRDEDAKELQGLFYDETERPLGEIQLRLEQYRNGEETVMAYDIIAGKGVTWLVRNEREGYTSEIYTVEALSRLLTECFGKE